MARFDLYEDRSGHMLGYVDVQSEFVEYLRTRLVVPVIHQKKLGELMPRLHVPLKHSEEPYYIVANLMTTVALAQLGRKIGNVENQSFEITTAIDFLMQGF